MNSNNKSSVHNSDVESRGGSSTWPSCSQLLRVWSSAAAWNSSSNNQNSGVVIDVKPLEVMWCNLGLLIGLGLLACITILGNCLVILAVTRTPSLKSSVTNYLIASLAVSDLLVGIIVMPFSIQFEVLSKRWLLSTIVCDIFHSIDVLASTASIWNLCVISLDRFFAVRDPLAYQQHISFRRAAIAIVIVWVSSSFISFPAIAWWRYDSAELYRGENAGRCEFTTSFSYICFSSLISFYIPLSIMLICYWRVYDAANAYEAALHSGRHEGICEKRIVTKQGSIRIRVHRGGGTIVGKPSIATAGGSPILNGSLSQTLRRESAISLTPQVCQRQHSRDPGSSFPRSPLTSPLARSRNSRRPSESSNNIDMNMVFQPLTQRVTQRVHGNQKQLEARQAFYRKLQRFTKEKKAAKTLGIVVGCFVLCWLPFFSLNVLTAIKDVQIHDEIMDVATWLGYCNSGLNPILYAFCSRDFRRAFKRLLRLKNCSKPACLRRQDIMTGPGFSSACSSHSNQGLASGLMSKSPVLARRKRLSSSQSINNCL